MKYITLIWWFCFSSSTISGTMLKNECPHDEVHKTCSFYDEYTCWENEMRTNRVKSVPKRLSHCRAGCYCKKGLVRSFPRGECILAISCRNQELWQFMKKLPPSFVHF